MPDEIANERRDDRYRMDDERSHERKLTTDRKTVDTLTRQFVAHEKQKKPAVREELFNEVTYVNK